MNSIFREDSRKPRRAVGFATATGAAVLAALATFTGTATASPMSTHTFTACGATGSSGPSLAACRSAYSTDWDESSDNFTSSDGIQMWKVPASGVYRIMAAGAQGGASGGTGARIQAEVTLTAGTWLQILVGQQGGSLGGGIGGVASGGGGGGTFITDDSGNPLVVAGGGGGAAYRTSGAMNASSSTSGNAGLSVRYFWDCYSPYSPCAELYWIGGSGGTDGNGGQAAPSNTSSRCSNQGDCTGGGGGGGGLSSDGGSIDKITGRYTAGGRARANGGGGSGASVSYSGGAAGGFGGGGGSGRYYFWQTGNTAGGGGGGGGYSGGGGGAGAWDGNISFTSSRPDNPGATSGGGGGSFTAQSATNVSAAGSNTGDGYVTVTRLTPAPPTVTAGPTGPTSDTSASFSVSGEGSTALRCSLDGGSWSACSSPASFSGLADGEHTASFKSVSAEGLESEATNATWTVDTVPPPNWDWAMAYTADWQWLQGANTLNRGIIAYGGLNNGYLYYQEGYTYTDTLQCNLDSQGWGACPSGANGPYYWVTYSDLPDGQHTLGIRAVDPAGNIGGLNSWAWQIGEPPASPTLTEQPNWLVGTGNASVSFTGESDGGFVCSLDNGTWNPCTSPVSLTGLADGPHNLAVKAKGSNGLVSQAATASWFVDTTPPAAPDWITGYPHFNSNEPLDGGRTYSTEMAFHGGSWDTGGPDRSLPLVCRLDGAELASCPGSGDKSNFIFLLSDIAVGSHTFSVSAVDYAGNVSAPIEYSWEVIPATPPGPPAISPWWSTRTDLSVAFSGVEGASFACSLDGDPYSPQTFTPCTSPMSFWGLPDGYHNLYVIQTDAFGSMSPVASVGWIVDSVPPAAPTLFDGPAAEVNSRSASVSISGEYWGGFECAFDSGAWEPCSSLWTATDIADGSHTLAVRQTDLAGNVGEAASISWEVDATAPTSPEVSSPLNGVSTKSRDAEFTASGESGATAMCSLDGGEWAPCPLPSGSNPGSGSRIGVGWQTILHWGEPSDWTSLAWGQTNATGGIQWNGSMDRAWFADGQVTMERVVGLVSQMLHVNLSCQYIDGIGPSMGIFITLATPDHSALNQYDLDCDDTSMPEVTGPTAATFRDLADGEHTLQVRFDDAAGNQGTVTSVTWTVDNTAPAPPQLYGVPSGTTNAGSATIDASGEQGGSFECSVDGGEWFACSSPWTGGFADGEHSFSSRQIDDAGNVGDAATAAWTVDTQAPQAPTVEGAPVGWSGSRSVTVTIGGGEAGATVECSLDGGAWAACPTGGEFTGLEDGQHSLAVRQVDAAGNVSDPTTAAWGVDATPPAKPDVTSPSNGAITSSKSAPFSATSSSGAALKCSLDGGAYAPCPVAGGSPGDGSMIDAGWNTILHWGEDPDWTNLRWGQTNPGGSVQWNGAWQRGLFDSLFGDGNVSIARMMQLVSYSVGLTLGCEYIRDIGSSAGIHIVAGVPDSSKRSSYNLDCDSSLAEITALTGAFESLSEGEHTLSVKAVSRSGNESPVTTTAWTVDTIAPAAPMIAGGPASTTNATSASFTFLGEAGTVFECSLDGGDFAPCGGPSKGLNDLASGQHSLSVRSVDAAGNIGAASTRSWTVQPLVVTAPALGPAPDPLNVASRLTASGWGVSGAISTAAASVSWQRCAAGESIDCSDIPASESPTLSSWTTKALDIGMRLRMRVSYTTPEGVTATAYSQRSAVVRPVAKSVAITSLGAGRTAPGTGVAVTAGSVSSTGWVAGESVTNWQWERCSSVQTRRKKAPKKRLAREESAYACSAIPGATAARYTPSNADVGQALRAGVSITTRGATSGVVYSGYTQRTVDITAPLAPKITAAPAALTNSTSGSLGFTGEPGGSFECAVDAGAFSPCASPKAVSSLSAGVHSFEVRQTDAAGNTGPAATKNWTVRLIEVTPPVIDAPAADPVGAGTTVHASGWDQTGAISVPSVTLKWQRCEIVPGSLPACNDIPGGNSTSGSSWTAGTADVGYLLRLKVTYRTSAGVTAIGYSDASGIVSPALKTGAMLSLGAGRATPRRGTTITTLRGATWVGWINGTSSETRQWERCTTLQASSCAAITGATRSWYIPQSADLGKYLRLRVTATTRTAATSAWTGMTPAVTAN